jgi:hypothetical protein
MCTSSHDRPVSDSEKAHVDVEQHVEQQRQKWMRTNHHVQQDAQEQLQDRAVDQRVVDRQDHVDRQDQVDQADQVANSSPPRVSTASPSSSTAPTTKYRHRRRFSCRPIGATSGHFCKW